MDLGTVKRKLERGKYKTAADCAADIRLVWTNCKTYNADGSDFYLLAEGFSRRFEDKYKKVNAVTAFVSSGFIFSSWINLISFSITVKR